MTGGHGHVTPNPDGSQWLCGGPTHCTGCALELVAAGRGEQCEAVLEGVRCERLKDHESALHFATESELARSKGVPFWWNVEVPVAEGEPRCEAVSFNGDERCHFRPGHRGVHEGPTIGWGRI